MLPKRWFRAGAIAVLSLALSSSIAVAQGHGHGHDRDDGAADDDRGHGHGNGKGHGRGHDRDRRSDYDRDEIHRWYRDHASSLPPGLAKRDRLPPGLERQLVVNGTLPPGLQKKIQPVPVDLEQILPPPPPNFRHVVIGGNLVLINRSNFQIASVFHFEIP